MSNLVSQHFIHRQTFDYSLSLSCIHDCKETTGYFQAGFAGQKTRHFLFDSVSNEPDLFSVFFIVGFLAVNVIRQNGLNY